MLDQILLINTVSLFKDVILLLFRHTVPGLRIVESTVYCNQIMLVPLCLNSTQKTSVNLDCLVNVIIFMLAQSDPNKQ